MKFIGDLSAQDAIVLHRFASVARDVLEFGVGGSTQVIAQSIDQGAAFVSLDTDPAWIETTRRNLQRLGVERRCRMLDYAAWVSAMDVDARFDLIFNDGVDHLRREFAIRAWPLLKVGGSMLFHDTRRQQDVRNVMHLVDVLFDEIEAVELNVAARAVPSNITIVRKKPKQPYVNWNAVEGKPPWAYGQGEVPEDFWSK